MSETLKSTDGPDPLGQKWLAKQAAIRQAELDKEEADRQAYIKSVHDEVAKKKLARIAEEATALGMTPEAFALIKSLADRLEAIEVKLGIKRLPPIPLSVDGFGRSLRDSALVDRAVAQVDPGAMLSEDRMASGGTRGLWNENGR
jgi:hypothetical protein